MRKRSYRALKINHVDHAELKKLVSGKRLVFGIDIAKDVCFGRLVTEEQQVLTTIKWHQIGDTQVLLDFLKSLPVGRLEVALEPSGTYGDALRYQLERVELPVFRVSGKRCHDAAEVYDGVPSMHDAKAADIVARLHLQGASSPWRRISDDERALAAAVQMVTVHDEQFERSCGRLEALLARHWPELTTVLELSSATLMSLLATFGSAQAVVGESEQAQAVMRKTGGPFLKPAKIDKVLQIAKQTQGIPMLEAERQMVMELASEADRSRCAARKARARVRALGKQDAEIAHLAAVVGPVTAAVIKVKAGSAHRYDGTKAYIKAMGLNLKERSSGKHKGQLKITKRGPSELRQYLYMAALRMVRVNGDEVVRAWYVRKVKRDGGRIKMKAVVAVLRKLAAALWHVARGAEFDSSKLFDTRRLGLKQA